MARVFPEPLVGSFPPEVLRIHRALKSIPDETLLVWTALPLPEAGQRPDFLVVHGGVTAFVISVSSLTESRVDEVVHGSLFAAGEALPPIRLGEETREEIRNFIHRALGEETAAETGQGPPAVYGLALFPNVPQARLQEAWPDNPHEGVYWLGQDYVSSEKLAACFRKLAHGGLQERQLARLRSHFTPEIVVPPRFSARVRPRRRLQAEFTPLLLDYDQEAWAKNRLHLPGIIETATSESALVTGVAGSGKSLVLLFRACTQARLHPQARSLVLTHNKALRGELERRFGELGTPANIDWHTYFSWIGSILGRNGQPSRMVQYAERDALIARAIEQTDGKTGRAWIEFVRDEIDWMQDRACTARDEYVKVERVGRGVRLSTEQRIQLHDVYLRYRALLAEVGGEDWSGLALDAWRRVETGAIRPAPYDYIYVDEAQFFAPVWFKTLTHALRPGSGRFLLAADPTQGFLKRRQSWLACGLDLRGRSTRLRRSYRNSREILQFALKFYRSRLSDEDERDLNLPDEQELASADRGETPQVIPLSSRQDEITRLLSELRAYLAEGGDASSVLVVLANGLRTQVVLQTLARELGEARVVDAKATGTTNAIRVCGLDAATGLEAPIVFVVGAAELLEAEEDLQLSRDQRGELRRDNTRRLYMAFTRAGQRLLITWTGKAPFECP